MTNLTLTLNLAVAGRPLTKNGRIALQQDISVHVHETFPNMRVIDINVGGWQEQERQAGTKIVNH